MHPRHVQPTSRALACLVPKLRAQVTRLLSRRKRACARAVPYAPAVEAARRGCDSERGGVVVKVARLA
eukprot:358565-Chlamydomonas_euryale.AAC.3